MGRVEIKKWAKEKIKGHIWDILVPIIVTGFLISLRPGVQCNVQDGKFSMGYYLGIFFAFVEVGFAAFMVKFIHDKEYNIKDLFAYTNDYVRIFVTKLLSGIFIALWSLLLIVPGVMKAYAYSLISLLLADDKYKDLSYMDILKKSEEIMNGHKMDLFIFDLSFVGWHLLAILTLGLLEIWIAPYYTTARYKMLDDIKAAAK